MERSTRRVLRSVTFVAVLVGVFLLVFYGWQLVQAWSQENPFQNPLSGAETFLVVGAGVILAGSIVAFWLLIGVGAFRATRDVPAAGPAEARAEVQALPAQPTPDEGALADLDLPITACPDCGFVGVRMAGIQEGVWPGGGSMVKVVCPRCDFIGVPLEFDAREDYAAFVGSLAARRA